MELKERARESRQNRSLRYGIAAMALCGGLAGAPSQSVAWADSASADSTSESAPSSTSHSTSGPSRDTGHVDSDRSSTKSEIENDDGRSSSNSYADAGDRGKPDTTRVRGAEPDRDPETADADADTDAVTEEAPTGVVVDDEPDPAQPGDTATDQPVDPEHGVVEHESTAHQGAGPEVQPVRGTDTAERFVRKHGHTADVDVSATPTPPSVPDSVKLSLTERETAQPAAVTSPTTVDAPPSVVRPLSPLAELLELPGRLVNAVLEAFDITASANSPVSPIRWGPINDLVFGAFRELERLLGLHRTPAAQPVVPTLTYTGPTTRPTPTVAQFLNASTAGYVLGSTPGGLVPFTVNGFQMSSTNIVTGMVGDVWVTPERQLIIAYQGTTGGTHLVFNPFIAVSQVLADLQMIFTPTTPPGFHDAVDFAQRVQAEAALQGFGSDDIFVTGHSLGGWQAQFVAQQTGLAGVGFEAPGMNSTVPGNGAESMFVNVGTYGSLAPYLSTDLPGLQPFMPAYVPGGGSKPHYGSIVMVGDPAAMTPLYNASQLWGRSLIGSAIFMVDALGNFGQYHMPGVQAYHLDIDLDPGVTPWLGTARGPVLTGYGALTIPQLMQAASDDGILFRP